MLAVAAIASWAACAASNETLDKDDDDTSGVGAGTAAGGNGGAGAGFAVGAGGNVVLPQGTLQGRVFAPEGTVPISGALVYATAATPDAIPQQVFCDTCVTLEGAEPFTKTAADGTFSFEVPTGDWNLVVQKGAFRRVRAITVQEGTAQVDAEMTRFPSARDAANGDDIPRIGVLQGVFDPIDEILQSFGVATVDVFTDHNAVIDD